MKTRVVCWCVFLSVLFVAPDAFTASGDSVSVASPGNGNISSVAVNPTSLNLRMPQLGPSMPELGLIRPPILGSTDSFPSRPPSGVAQIVAGWIATGAAALNLVTLPVCFASSLADYGLEWVCVGTSVGLATIGLAMGVPLLIIGYGKRKKYKAWEAEQASMLFQRTRIQPLLGGAAATYSFEF